MTVLVLRWLTSSRVREYRRMTRRGWTLVYDSNGDPRWV